MLNNFVNRHDFAKLGGKLLSGNWARIAALTRLGSRRRTEAAWQHVRGKPTHWWDVPGMQRRWNALAAGDPALEPRRHFAEQHLAERTNLRGLSLGCGAGSRELAWARLGVFARLDAIDLSAPRIESARAAARSAGLEDVLRFECGDVLAAEDRSVYDVVIVEQSLHHFAPMRTVVEKIRARLAPGGLLYVDEFVGPNRFQWSDAQLAAANMRLRILPERLRLQAHDGRVRRRVIRPSRLSMRLRDPSEAIESESILPELRRAFEVVEENGYGGALLHLLFENIAQNFDPSEPGVLAQLDAAFAAEDAALADGTLPHDFVVAVYRKSN